ncbi:MAG: sugar-specific transcriptional regulator TrmB [Candidatus Azotimanducaceae bacterium]|jgi:sugar-specific transcriptional regulator TrmB
MIIHETLSLLGLSNRETDIYLALLKLGPCSIRDIASEAEINRGTTYETLKALKNRALVSYYPVGKRRFFCAEPPENLINLLEEKQETLDRASHLLRKEIVPDLIQLNPGSDSTTVRQYEGDDGIEFVLKDILKTVSKQPADTKGEKRYRVYSSKLIRKYLYRPLPNFTRMRVQKNVHVNVIAIGDGGESAPLSARKWIPDQNINLGASYVAIYPPKCAMISLTRGDYPSAVVIDSLSIAQAMSLSFDTLWDRL